MIILLSIAGGVALILFATRFLREGLDRVVGANLGPFIQRASRTPVRAFLAGLGTSALAPSSTTMSSLAVQAVQSGLVNGRQMLLIMAGADIGLTLMVWLSALNIQHYAPIIILCGGMPYMFAVGRKARGIGQAILALGLMFQGMILIQTAMDPATLASPDLQSIMTVASKYPWVLAALAGIMSVILQSSTATILLVLSLGAATSGSVFSLDLAIPVVIGANVGITITTMILGWASYECRRLAIANLLAKLAMAAIFLTIQEPLHIVEWMRRLPGDFAQHVAYSHTAFNIAKALVLLPLLTPLTRLSEWLIPTPQKSGANSAFGPRYINAGSFDGVSLAMGQSAREIMHAAEIVRSMFEDLWRAIKNNDESLVRQIAERDNQVDLLDAEIRRFLARLNAQPMDAQDQQEQMRQIRYMTELEAIGDIIDKNLCKLAIKKIKLNIDFGSQGWAELDDFDSKVSQNMLIADTAFQTRDKVLADKLLRHKDHIDLTIRELRDKLFARFTHATEADYESSAIQLDILTNLKRINSHVSHVAYALIYDSNYTATVAPGGSSGLLQ